ncbi:aminotransferase class V-fold PLP-dependent enzyme [Longimicrobium sp.]|uniref:aminotransferase class V-fold PLP-dependent enzyme n=1 Tax=Longimicrobium sp. TaxID=2029185 RepID=UPI003B3A90FD
MTPMIWPSADGTMERLLARWRAATPGCAHRNHLNNAGSALPHRAVVQATINHLELESEIGGYEAAGRSPGMIQAAYGSIARLLGAKPENVAIVGNGTAGFIQALTCFDLERGDAIVTSRSDYTSNQIQYLALSERLGVRIIHAPDLPEGGIDPGAVREILRSTPVRLVAVSWIPTHAGLVQDVESVGEVCEELGVPFVVDAVQAVGQIPVDVHALRCDYLVGTARKFLRGPRGIGFLYASDRALARGDYPLFVDMRGARWTAPVRFEVAATARRYEDWEFPYALVAGMGAAVDYALAQDVGRCGERAFALGARLRQGLEAMDGVQVLDRGTRRCAVVTAAVAGCTGHDVVAALAAERINAVATLREFAIHDFGPRGVESGVRLSPHYYNTEDEVDAALAVIERTARSARH